MAAYALAHTHEITSVEGIGEYLKRIDATLEPFGGRFIIHGSPEEVAEGSWAGHLTVIEFPDFDKARAWYDSPEYQEILPLRVDNSRADGFLIGGVPEGYRPGVNM
jgi:uncharacterized protein (DUF1330 family)